MHDFFLIGVTLSEHLSPPHSLLAVINYSRFSGMLVKCIYSDKTVLFVKKVLAVILSDVFVVLRHYWLMEVSVV